MKEILAFLPTYAPDAGNEPSYGRPYTRLKQRQIADRINEMGIKSRARPWLYMDSIDSIVNTRPDIELIVADARSSEIIRDGLSLHNKSAGGYSLAFYPDKLSQWVVFNDILSRHATMHTKYFVYTSSDIIWAMDWIAEAVAEFDKDPSLMIIFPTVNAGDPAMPLQVAPGPYDAELIDPADHMNSIGVKAARAPCLNMYLAIFRMEFLREYGGYMDIWRNCFSESFLYYLCEAMGGKMRLMPKGWAYHHNGADSWGIGTEAGQYNYHAEKPVFDAIMDKVQEARKTNTMTREFLKEVLWKKSA